MTNYKLTIEYDGSNYSGWQRQADQATVQEEIELALEKTMGAKITLYGAGRTDAGVHALGQVANFKANTRIPIEKITLALQSRLPRDIFIKRAEIAPDSFHSRFDARARTYLYRLSPFRSALERQRRWEEPNLAPLSLPALKQTAELFEGQMDCSALCLPGSLLENNICHIHRCSWKASQKEYHFEIVANRFLHSMVRVIVGFSVRVARTIGGAGETGGTGEAGGPGASGSLTLERLKNILKAGEWTKDHLIAPPQGLYLVKVDYPSTDSTEV